MKTFPPLDPSFYASVLILPLLVLGCRTSDRQQATPTAVTPTSGTASTIGFRHEPQVAKILRVQGAARYSLDGDAWYRVKAGQSFRQPGWTLQTAAGASVDVLISEQEPSRPNPDGELLARPPKVSDHNSLMTGVNVLKLKERSILKIEQLTTFRNPKKWEEGVKNIQVHLESGKLLVTAGKLLPGSTCEVRTKGFTVRATNDGIGAPNATFQLSTEGLVQVLLGVVKVTQTNANLGQEIPAGRQMNAQTGKVTTLPEFGDGIIY